MLNKLIRKKIKVLILINTMTITCYASNVSYNKENFFNEKQIIIRQSINNDFFHRKMKSLSSEDNQIEKIDIQSQSLHSITQINPNFSQEFLLRNTSLKSLTLKNCGLTYQDTNYIWEALRYNFNFPLQVLDLSNNSLSHQTTSESYDILGPSFGPAIQLSETLNELYLDNINSQDPTMKDLYLKNWRVKCVAAAFTVNKQTTILSLKSNKIDDFGALLLSKMLMSNRSLQKLDLSDNDITAYGLQLLAFSLNNNTSLKELNLKGNHIIEKDIISLRASSKNKIIKI